MHHSATSMFQRLIAASAATISVVATMGLVILQPVRAQDSPQPTPSPEFPTSDPVTPDTEEEAIPTDIEDGSASPSFEDSLDEGVTPEDEDSTGLDGTGVDTLEIDPEEDTVDSDFDPMETDPTMDTVDPDAELDPFEPSVSPTAPGVDPMEPGASPTAPGVDPFEPSVSPTAPGVDPFEPSVSPTEPDMEFDPTSDTDEPDLEPGVNPTTTPDEPTFTEPTSTEDEPESSMPQNPRALW